MAQGLTPVVDAQGGIGQEFTGLPGSVQGSGEGWPMRGRADGTGCGGSGDPGAGSEVVVQAGEGVGGGAGGLDVEEVVDAWTITGTVRPKDLSIMPVVWRVWAGWQQAWLKWDSICAASGLTPVRGCCLSGCSR